MSDKTKLRLQVAYDAWQLTRINKFVSLEPGGYMAPEFPAQTDDFLDDVAGAPLQEVPPCSVCALGALFLAKVTQRLPADGPLCDTDFLRREDIVCELPFDSVTLDTIETLFERDYIYRTAFTSDEVNELLSSAGDMSGWSPDTTARALFLNLLENEGELKLNRKRPYMGLSGNPDYLTEEAKAVLLKHGIPLHPFSVPSGKLGHGRQHQAQDPGGLRRLATHPPLACSPHQGQLPDSG
jgi:hypothetical protein